MQDVALQPLPVHVPLARHLLARRQDRLDPAQIDENRLGIFALLDHPRDNVALLPGELPERQLVLSISQPLQDDLTSRGGRDPAEARRRVVVLGEHGPVLVCLRGPHRDVPGAPIHLNPGRWRRPV